MCLLVVCSPNSTPQKKQLEMASCNNPHGFGYAIIAGDKIIANRGMSYKKVIKEFLEMRKKHPKGYAMFHARFATHGVKNEENCQPFRVGENPDTYLAHNGILDIKIDVGDKRSDSRVFAEDLLPLMGGVPVLDNDNVMKMVSGWALGSKIAILTLDPRTKSECYIINESDGHWDNFGMWWSNTTYLTDSWSSYWKNGTSAGDYAELEGCGAGYEEEICPACHAICYDDVNPYYCDMCHTCFDCQEVYANGCLCYIPSEEKQLTLAQSRDAYHYNYGSWD